MNQPFNPIAYQGTHWYQVRETSTGLYVDRFVELSRSRSGTIHLGCPALLKAKIAWSTEKPMNELLTQAEMIDRIAAANRHPATTLMLGGWRPLQQYVCPNPLPLLC
ncbi:MAG: hypothetical protein EBU46_06085 [Nitrosomonadaceae bacterium]|nr:hypothetical protein [Nitrosomonadaceae bacterium]